MELKMIELLATIGTLIGYFLITKDIYILGLTIGLFSNIIWLYIGHERNMLGLMITNFFFIIINLNGLGAI